MARDAGNESTCSSSFVSVGNSWLDNLPGVVAGVFYRTRIAEHFKSELAGQIHTYSEKSDLKVHVLNPRNALDPRCQKEKGTVVFIHGGGFLGGAPSQLYPYARIATNRFGLNSALCEYRTKFSHPLSRMPYDAVEDVGQCIKFLQDHSESLHIDRSKVILVGASSGGHLAAMTALGNPSLQLAGLALFNPVLDLRFAADWWHRQWLVKLGSLTLQLLSSSQELETFSPAKRTTLLPFPIRIMHGTDDKLVPLKEVQGFCSAMREEGNDCRLHVFPGAGHYFFNWRISPSNFERCIGILEDFFGFTRIIEKDIS